MGDGSSSKVVVHAEMPTAVVTQLIELMDDLIARLDEGADEEMRADAAAVRAELAKKKVNLRLIRPALKGVAASIGTAQSMSDLVTNILSLVGHLR
jgi:hypothetical protein